MNEDETSILNKKMEKIEVEMAEFERLGAEREKEAVERIVQEENQNPEVPSNDDASTDIKSRKEGNMKVTAEEIGLETENFDELPVSNGFGVSRRETHYGNNRTYYKNSQGYRRKPKRDDYNNNRKNFYPPIQNSTYFINATGGIDSMPYFGLNNAPGNIYPFSMYKPLEADPQYLSVPSSMPSRREAGMAYGYQNYKRGGYTPNTQYFEEPLNNTSFPNSQGKEGKNSGYRKSSRILDIRVKFGNSSMKAINFQPKKKIVHVVHNPRLHQNKVLRVSIPGSQPALVTPKHKMNVPPMGMYPLPFSPLPSAAPPIPFSPNVSSHPHMAFLPATVPTHSAPPGFVPYDFPITNDKMYPSPSFQEEFPSTSKSPSATPGSSNAPVVDMHPSADSATYPTSIYPSNVRARDDSQQAYISANMTTGEMPSMTNVPAGNAPAAPGTMYTTPLPTANSPIAYQSYSVMPTYWSFPQNYDSTVPAVYPYMPPPFSGSDMNVMSNPAADTLRSYSPASQVSTPPFGFVYYYDPNQYYVPVSNESANATSQPLSNLDTGGSAPYDHI
ncbi:Schizosaccharomyces specific protein [Schizosaccharomyces pombe]|uniref:Uncharacterized protein C622.15c n=1 Tax=Schizosaccharomyces pombe (strain 972 / ATCC 24843) TaxID=284812 RepID=YC8F_SCHPO|nr:uncharacterized protein SPCC622.15c [Schizosaccharomyces pombe]O94602.1 RecName: Full=Uncharacterized protein C622.15c [Schizosaccharomyces pombe 972h-]CAA21871.1 sequence orphan [Schizosaccharomyces pombe]|eukprot:NP_588187.1 uncharacterized protein SPCC622.15c [Schizosaccharomyces pombe]